MTLGANYQGDDDVQNVGAEALWATVVGTFGLDLSASHLTGSGDGTAARASYEYYEGNRANSRNRSFVASIIYRSPDFAVLGADEVQNAIAVDGFARYSQRLSDSVSMGIGASYQLGRNDRTDTHNIMAISL